MAEITTYIAQTAIEMMRSEIAEAGGREVFFIGTPDENSIVQSVRVVARGNEGAVAAVTRDAKPGDVAIHNHPGGNLEPSNADVDVSSIAACSGIASLIVNNEVTQCYVLVEPMKPTELKPLSVAQVASVLDPGGPMAQVLPRYEERPAQREMLSEIVQAFNDNAISVIEAGTGTGKTVAYLIPSVVWALKNEERIVIATHTINLQEQLIKKDIPLVQQIIPKPFKATLVKGRNNYVCLRKAHMIEEEEELFADEEKDELKYLADWAFASNTGDKAELNISPRPHLWERIHSTGETCFKSRCPYFNECFVVKARRDAAHAHILVTNHALLFSDIKLKMENENSNDTTILPQYRRVVIDEAHNIEDVATKHFGSTASRRNFLRTLNMLHRQTGGEGGSLSQLSRHVYREIGKCNDEDSETIETCVEEIQRIVAEELPAVRYTVEDGFEALTDVLSDLADENTRNVQYRITPQQRKGEIWQNCAMILEDIRSIALRCVTALTHVTKRISDLPLDNDKIAGALLDVNAHTGWLYNYAMTIEGILTDEGVDFVNWLEVQVSSTYINASVHRAPLDITAAMIHGVYSQYATVILTSATLTSRNSFDFLETRIGLGAYKKLLGGGGANEETYTARPVRELILPTHFDYANKALMLIPDDVSSRYIQLRQQNETDEVVMAQAIHTLVSITEGASFVLFTSYGMMRKMANELSDTFAADELTLFVQGTMQRDELLRSFRRTPRAVLFGTDSFWAGVDVTGSALTHVIITKLPFSVPTDPIIEARAEFIDANGGRSFIEYTIPMAVLKFRQGFGRLIRSTHDYGLVSVLDRRVVKKRYGKWFLESLPDAQRVTGEFTKLVEVATKFIGGHTSHTGGETKE